MKKIFKILCLSLFLGFLLPSFSQAAQAPELKRLFGSSRVSTSLEISKEAYKEAKTVVLVGYSGEVDALTGSLLAASKDAPVIFADARYLKEVKERLVDLKTQKVYVLGGENVFSKKLFQEFKDYNPSRIQGKNRFETAAKICQEIVGSTTDKAFLALGVDVYADALALGPIAAKNQIPILLTDKKGLPKETKEALKSMKVKQVDIVGGSKAVPLSVEEELKQMNIKVNRTYGDSRELTAIAIAQKFNPNPENIILANGWKYSDAVVAGYFAAQRDAVLLLSHESKIDPAVLDYMKDKKLDTFLLGGSKAIGSNIMTKVLSSSGGSIVVDSLNILEKHSLSKDPSIFLKLDREINSSKLEIALEKDSQAIEVGQIQTLDNNTSLKLIFKEPLEAGSYKISLAGLTASPLVAKLEVSTSLSAGVSSEDELRLALQDKTIEEIVILKDIKLKAPLTIDRSLSIKGNNKTIQAPYWGLYDENDLHLKGVLTVVADNVRLENLTIKSKEDINIFFDRVKGGELRKVSLLDAASSALSVFSSQIKVEDLTTETSDLAVGIELVNNYYDLKTDKIVFIEDPKLTLVGSHKHKPGNPKENVAVFIIGKDKSSRDWLVGGDYVVVEEFKGSPYVYNLKVK